jgi:hypothetical protein
MSRPHVIAFLTLLVVAGMIGYVGCDGGATLTRTAVQRPPAGPATRPAMLHTPGAPLAEGAIVLLVTGHANGNLEPCDCPGEPMGGLSRRKTMLDSLQSEFGRCILLDNGNLLSLTPDPVGDGYMIEGLARLGYDAVAVGDQELDRGPADFLAAADRAALPLVATNVKLADGRAIGLPARVVQCRGRTVLVLAVVGQRIMQFAGTSVREQMTLADPVETVNRAIEQSARTSRPDLVVVLANLDAAERESVLSGLRGVDLVVLSTEQDRAVTLEECGGVLSIFAPTMGRRIAAVVCEPAAVTKSAGKVGSRLRVARVHEYGVPQSLPRDRALWDRYRSYTYDREQRSLRLLGRVGQVKFADPDQCGRCHAAQFEWWKRQPHARAWSAIQRAGRTSDPNCARCHTTGFGSSGGFSSAGETPALAGVGCQACHQVDPGPHKPAGGVPVKIGAMTCRGCHTAAAGKKFDFATYGPKVVCPSSKASATQPN